MFSKTEEFPIDDRKVKAYVEEKMTYNLQDHIWIEINSAFSEKWNCHLGYGAWFYWDEFSWFVFERLRHAHVLLDYEHVDKIVTHMLTYIESNGGFLKDD